MEDRVRVRLQDREIEWEITEGMAASLMQTLAQVVGPGKEVNAEVISDGPQSGEWTEVWAYHRPSKEYFFTHEFYLECVIDGRFYFGRYNIDKDLLVEKKESFSEVMYMIMRSIHNEWVQRTMRGMLV